MVVIAFSGSFFNSCCVFDCSVLAHRRIKIAFRAKQAVGMWSCKLTWVGSPGVNRWLILHCVCTQHPTAAGPQLVLLQPKLRLKTVVTVCFIWTQTMSFKLPICDQLMYKLENNNVRQLRTASEVQNCFPQSVLCTADLNQLEFDFSHLLCFN